MRRHFSSSRGVWREIQNHYEVLGVKVNATGSEIKQRFFELSRKYHPDRNVEADPERYQQITQAYTVLSSESERRKFDQQLGTAVRRPEGYHSGRSWSGRRPGTSGFNYNAQTQFAAKQAHEMRKSSSLDPLRPTSQSKSVPHFDFQKHARMHLKNDQRHRASRARAEQSPIQPQSAATEAMRTAPSNPHAAGMTFFIKAAAAASAGAGFVWLLLR